MPSEICRLLMGIEDRRIITPIHLQFSTRFFIQDIASGPIRFTPPETALYDRT
jgi:hypothetical protein